MLLLIFLAQAKQLVLLDKLKKNMSKTDAFGQMHGGGEGGSFVIENNLSRDRNGLGGSSYIPLQDGSSYLCFGVVGGVFFLLLFNLDKHFT